jgi:hypothetical protein
MSTERNFKKGDLVDYDGGILQVKDVYKVTPSIEGLEKQTRVVAQTPNDDTGVIVDAPDYYFVKVEDE